MGQGTNQTHIKLLGSFELHQDGEVVTSLRTRRALAVVAYFVVQRQPVTRKALLEIVWSDKSPDDAKANLSWVLGYLDQLLPKVIGRDRNAVWLEPDVTLTVDLWQLRDGNTSVLTGAGDFLDGFYLAESAEFELWLLAERERIRIDLADRLQSAIDHCRLAGNWKLATRYAQQLIDVDPWLENGYRLSMELLARQEKFEAAAVQYRRLEALLSAELDVPPATRTTQLHRRIQRLSQQQRLHLLAQPTQFIGRIAGIEQIAHALRQPNERLITLHALGGMGKTRLAIEVGRQLAPDFLDGVHFIPLISANDLAQSIAATLVQQQAIPSPTDSDLWQHLSTHLADRELLLILDNFEPLAAQAGSLLLLLDAAPQVKLLVTSRVQLGLSIEQVVIIDGLLDESALALFAQTTAAVRPQLPLQSAEMETAVAICQLLEGMPLGIELAASWLRARPIDTISAGIKQTLATLSTAMRDVPLRQRSMQAVFDYSWTQLPEAAQATYARLAVFKNDFSAEIAHAVTAASPQMLGLLWQHALLQRHGPAYSVHSLLREFAWAKLPHAQQQATRQRHADAFAALLASNRPKLEGGGQIDAVALLASYESDLIAVWHFAVTARQWAITDAMLVPTFLYFEMSNQYQRGYALLAELEEQVRQQNDGKRLGSVLAYRTFLNPSVGTRRPQAEEAYQLTKASDDYSAHASAAIMLSHSVSISAEPAEWQHYAHEALTAAERAEDTRLIVRSLVMLGIGDEPTPETLEQSLDYLQRAVEVATSHEDTRGMAVALHNLGWRQFYAGEYVAAEAQFAEVADLQRQLGAPLNVAVAQIMGGARCCQTGAFA